MFVQAQDRTAMRDIDMEHLNQLEDAFRRLDHSGKYSIIRQDSLGDSLGDSPKVFSVESPPESARN